MVRLWGGHREQVEKSGEFQVGPDDIPLCQGVTDSEKRVQHLTLENEALKQSLSLTRDLLLHWGPGPLTKPPQVLCHLAAMVSAVQIPVHLASSNST